MSDAWISKPDSSDKATSCRSCAALEGRSRGALAEHLERIMTGEPVFQLLSVGNDSVSIVVFPLILTITFIVTGGVLGMSYCQFPDFKIEKHTVVVVVRCVCRCSRCCRCCHCCCTAHIVAAVAVLVF